VRKVKRGRLIERLTKLYLHGQDFNSDGRSNFIHSGLSGPESGLIDKKSKRFSTHLFDPKKTNNRMSNIQTRKGSYYEAKFNHSLVHDLKEFDEFKAQKLTNYFKDRDEKQSEGHKIQKYPTKATADSIKNFLFNNSINPYVKNNLNKSTEIEYHKGARPKYGIVFYNLEGTFIRLLTIQKREN
jgi:hypothetical protein